MIQTWHYCFQFQTYFPSKRIATLEVTVRLCGFPSSTLQATPLVVIYLNLGISIHVAFQVKFPAAFYFWITLLLPPSSWMLKRRVLGGLVRLVEAVKRLLGPFPTIFQPERNHEISSSLGHPNAKLFQFRYQQFRLSNWQDHWPQSNVKKGPNFPIECPQKLKPANFSFLFLIKLKHAWYPGKR